MFQSDLSRTMTQILLSLYGSEKTVERLPVVRVYEPREIVAIVPMSASYAIEAL